MSLIHSELRRVSVINTVTERALVAERVAERGDIEDFYAMFSLYGGVDKVRDIYKNEVRELSSRALAFICIAFNLKKEEMRCYIRRRSKAIPWDY